MIQTIIIDVPPMYDEIAATFNLRPDAPVIFSWGDRIYNPNDLVIPPELMAHEAAHGREQGTSSRSVTDWWKRYIDDPQFRFAEELIGHHAELRYLLDHGNRKQRRAAYRRTAERLSGPLYGNVTTRLQAERMLKALISNDGESKCDS